MTCQKLRGQPRERLVLKFLVVLYWGPQCWGQCEMEAGADDSGGLCQYSSPYIMSSAWYLAGVNFPCFLNPVCADFTDTGEKKTTQIKNTHPVILIPLYYFWSSGLGSAKIARHVLGTGVQNSIFCNVIWKSHGSVSWTRQQLFPCWRQMTLCISPIVVFLTSTTGSNLICSWLLFKSKAQHN